MVWSTVNPTTPFALTWSINPNAFGGVPNSAKKIVLIKLESMLTTIRVNCKACRTNKIDLARTGFLLGWSNTLATLCKVFPRLVLVQNRGSAGICGIEWRRRSGVLGDWA